MVFQVPGDPLFLMSELPTRYGGDSNVPVSLSAYQQHGVYDSNTGSIAFSTFDDQVVITPPPSPPPPSSSNNNNTGFNVNLNRLKLWHQTSNVDGELNLLNACFSNAYYYEYDGNEELVLDVPGEEYKVASIRDGGDDLYDGGEIMGVSGTRIPGNCNVAFGDIWTTNTNGYYVSDAGAWPHLTLAYIQDEDVTIRVRGNIGSDGEASVSNSPAIPYTASNARYGNFWVNMNLDLVGLSNYNDYLVNPGNWGSEEGGAPEVPDASVNSVWFTVFDSNAWNNSQIVVGDNRKQEDTGLYDMSMSFLGSNFIAGHFLLSLSNAAAPSITDVGRFVSAFVSRMPITYTSSNVNVDERHLIEYIDIED